MRIKREGGTVLRHQIMLYLHLDLQSCENNWCFVIVMYKFDLIVLWILFDIFKNNGHNGHILMPISFGVKNNEANRNLTYNNAK